MARANYSRAPKPDKGQRSIAEVEPPDWQYWVQLRMAAIREQGKLRRFKCPYCFAPPGEDCHTSGWRRHDVGHAARRKRAGLDARRSAS